MPETLRVREHIELFSSYYPKPLKLEETIAAAGLAEYEKRLFGELSGGQKQRLLFALAICGNPDLLFLDEPTVGLDVAARRGLWTHIRGFVERGGSVLLTTHYLDEADALADRIAVIDQGRIIAQGTPAEIKQRGASAGLEDAFLSLVRQNAKFHRGGAAMMHVYWMETRTELLKFARMKTYALSTILFPLMFYCFFGLAMAPQNGLRPPMARYLIATYGAFAIMGSTLYAFGAGSRWSGARLAGSEARQPDARGSLLLRKRRGGHDLRIHRHPAVVRAGRDLRRRRMAPAQWAAALSGWWRESSRSAPLGLTIGSLAGPNSAPATVNMIYMPLAFCGGLWIPFDFLPKASSRWHPFCPPIILRRSRWRSRTRRCKGSIGGHVAALAAFT